MAQVMTPYRLATRCLCGKCNKNLSMGPIVVDDDGTYLCGRCSNPEQLVPGMARATALEALCTLYKWPCLYQSSGCLYLGSFGTTKAHEDGCAFGPFYCPMPRTQRCHKTLCKKNSEDHFIKEHVNDIMETNTFRISQMRRNKYERLFRFGGRFFVLSVDVTFTPKKCKLWLTPLVWPDMSDVWYTITVTEAATPNVFMGKRQKVTSIGGLENTLVFCFASMANHFDNKKNFVFKLEVEKTGGSPNSSTNNLVNISSDTQINRDRFLGEFECPVCKDYMAAPIVLCETGHSLCRSCMDNCQGRCPICQGRDKGTRNFSLERLASCVGYPCINKEHGCTFTGTISSITEHETICLSDLHPL